MFFPGWGVAGFGLCTKLLATGGALAERSVRMWHGPQRAPWSRCVRRRASSRAPRGAAGRAVHNISIGAMTCSRTSTPACPIHTCMRAYGQHPCCAPATDAHRCMLAHAAPCHWQQHHRRVVKHLAQRAMQGLPHSVASRREGGGGRGPARLAPHPPQHASSRRGRFPTHAGSL